MFKRANKVTSLLVAAAAVISLVPASAADVKKIDSEDGTVYNAVAYKDGKAYVDGEINDDEEAYYVADGTQTALEDIDSGDDTALFGEKYLDVNDGDYTINLEDGTVTDDDTPGDTADDAASALRKKIKDDTDDRYVADSASGVYATDDIKDAADADSVELDKLNVIPGAKYAAPWYYTIYTSADASDPTGTNQGSTTLNVFTDTDGNYIDADYNLGKVKVTTTGDATKTVTIENTGDTYDTAKTKDAVSASVKQLKVLTQDGDNIYRLVEVTVKATDGSDITKINDTTIESATTALEKTKSGSTTTVIFNAVQKISKAQATGDVDGAKYAKSVTTYAVSDDDGVKLAGIEGVDYDSDDMYYTVAGGKLIAYNFDSDNKGVNVQAYTLKSSSGYYYMDDEDKSSEDCEVSAQDSDAPAVHVDASGNLWRLDGGYLYKFDNTDDWDKVYKVDGSFDEFSVYDQDNIVAWSEDDEVYSLIGAKEATDDTTTPETPVVTAGWVQAANGTWSYNKADGTKATGWLNLNGTWYYLKADGVMATGWVQDGATWYYLQSSGAMATGWLNDNGTWYYLNASGAMLANTTVDGYVLGANGAWVK